MTDIPHQVIGQRRSGRTTRMIQALPEDTICIVIAWHTPGKSEMQRLVHELRGAAFAQYVRFVTLAGQENCAKLRGLHDPVWADHFVWEEASIETRRTLRELGVKGEEFC